MVLILMMPAIYFFLWVLFEDMVGDFMDLGLFLSVWWIAGFVVLLVYVIQIIVLVKNILFLENNKSDLDHNTGV